MALTAETLARHELRGLRVRVADASNHALVDIEGVVVDETEGTLSVETDSDESSVKQIPKTSATFEFALDEESVTPADIAYDPASATAYVTVDGERLVAKPARRTETTGDSIWR